MTAGSKRAWVAAAVGGILASFVCGWLLATRPATVRVDRGPVGERIVARAVVAASEGVTHVYAKVSGQLKRIAVREGDRVDAGQTLAEIENAAAITAPVRGAVLGRQVEVGDYVQAGPAAPSSWLFELADVTKTELRVEVEAADAARISRGMDVAIQLIGAREPTAHGRVERLAPRLERRNIGAEDARVRADGMVRALSVTWSGEHPAWPIGTRVEAVLALATRLAETRIPRAALSVRDGRPIVERPAWFWTREVAVEIVRVDTAYAEIRGLAPGTEVVVPADAIKIGTTRASARVDAAEAVR